MAKIYYFQHDFAARQDPKLLAVQARFGLEGLGFFWCLVEYLYEQGGQLAMSSIEPFAYQCHIDAGKAVSIVNDFELFETDGESFWSPSIMRRIEKMTETAEKRSQAAAHASRSRWQRVADQPAPKKTTKSKEVDFEGIVDLFHRCCPSLSAVQKITDGRRRKIATRMGEIGSMDTWQEIFERVERSDFMKGANDRGWKVDFDWIIDSETHWRNIMSGRYDNRAAVTQGAQTESNKTNQIWK